jgi:hypothetical protein
MINNKDRKMKILIVLSAAFILFAGTINAQQRLTPQERAKNLKESLGLTNEQTIKVEQILTNSNAEIQKLQAGEIPDREQFREIRENSNKAILDILTEKQKTEFNKMLEERMSGRKSYRNNKNQ